MAIDRRFLATEHFQTPQEPRAKGGSPLRLSPCRRFAQPFLSCRTGRGRAFQCQMPRNSRPAFFVPAVGDKASRTSLQTAAGGLADARLSGRGQGGGRDFKQASGPGQAGRRGAEPTCKMPMSTAAIPIETQSRTPHGSASIGKLSPARNPRVLQWRAARPRRPMRRSADRESRRRPGYQTFRLQAASGPRGASRP